MLNVFSIAPNKKLAIQARLKELSLPDSITRISFDLAKCLSWKASENRTFYLYLALPLLKPYLPEVYFVHLYSFVYGKVSIFFPTSFVLIKIMFS